MWCGPRLKNGDKIPNTAPSTARCPQFFFVEYDPEEVVQGGGQGGGGMAMLMRAMEREEHEAGTSLMEQVFSTDIQACCFEGGGGALALDLFRLGFGGPLQASRLAALFFRSYLALSLT